MNNFYRTYKQKKEVTIREVAAMAGVSPATVGRVVGGYGSVAESTRNRVLQAIRELNYHHNGIAQSMKGKRTHTIGLVVSNICNPFFSTIVRAVEDTVVKYDYNVIVCNSDESIAKELSYIQTLYEKRIDGLLVSTAYEAGKKAGSRLKNFYQGNIPIVFIDRHIDELNVPVVQADNFGGAYEAITHLIRLGHKKIGVITGTPSVTTMAQRIAGYKKALNDHNITFDANLIKDGGNVQVNGGIEATQELLRDPNRRPTALFALNNLLATGALLAIDELGLKIPDDIAIIGWDDFELASLLKPPLTVVTQPTYTIGTMAAEKLISMLSKDSVGNFEQEPVIVLKTKLIIRRSCGYKG